MTSMFTAWNGVRATVHDAIAAWPPRTPRLSKAHHCEVRGDKPYSDYQGQLQQSPVALLWRRQARLLLAALALLPCLPDLCSSGNRKW